MLTNPVFLWAHLHVLLASLVTAAVVMLAVAAWQMRRGAHSFQPAARLALIVLAPSIVFAMLVGSGLGVIEARYQPMKIAAAEAQWETCQPCAFSLFQIGGGNADQNPTKLIEVPHLLSLLATNSWNGKVVGLNEVQAQYEQRYGPGYYVPNVFVQYWSMRVMAYLAGLIFLLAAWGIWLLWRRRLATSGWFARLAIWALPLPFLMNTAGWLLTESGRQPWIVQGVQLTRHGVSPSLDVAGVAISLVVFFLLYAVLAVVDIVLMMRYARRELGPERPADEPEEPMAAMTY